MSDEEREIDKIEIDLDKAETFRKRHIMPKIEGQSVRVSNSRISYTIEMDDEIGNPEYVALQHIPENLFVIRPTDDINDGYKVQRQSKTTRDVASKAFISHMKIPPGIYDAKVEGDIIAWMVKKKK